MRSRWRQLAERWSTLTFDRRFESDVALLTASIHAL
jgi:hypothetical protein